MRIYKIGDSSTKTMEFRASDDSYALVQRPNSSGGYLLSQTKTIILSQQEALINLHNALHEEIRLKGEGRKK